MQRLYIHKKRVIALLILVNCFIGLGLFLIYTRSHSPNSISIILTAEGFSPNNITIRQNTTVTFKSNQSNDFWPASDPHPTHTTFPTFDPQHPVKSSESWSFTFSKTGTWAYHDHLHPLYRGTITVNTQNKVSNDKQELVSIDRCNKTLQPNSCYEKALEQLLISKGVKETLDTAAELTRTTPPFLASCHDQMHKVGQEAFDLYKSQKTFETSASASICGYGFYHGFMGKLLATGTDIAIARTYCENMTKTEPLLVSNACFHGIGHGVVEYLIGKYATKLDSLLTSSVDMCTKIVGTENRWKCLSGVFMEISTDLSGNIYKFTFDKKNPLSVCQKLEQSVRSDCYNQFYSVVLSSAQGDIAKAIQQIMKLQPQGDRIYPLQNLVGTATELSQSEKILKICHTLPTAERKACIDGITLAYLLKSDAGREYTNTTNFCTTSFLSEQEKDNCFHFTLDYMQNSQSQSVFEALCTDVPAKYKQYCMNQDKKPSTFFTN